MESLILDILPDRFRELQEMRAEQQAKAEALGGKLDVHRAKTTVATAELRRHENEIASTVAAAGDPAQQLAKLRKLRDVVKDLESIEVIAENAQEGVQNEIRKINVELAALLQAAVIQARNTLGDQLQAEVDVIEAAIREWGACVFETAERFALETPASGGEIILKGLR